MTPLSKNASIVPITTIVPIDETEEEAVSNELGRVSFLDKILINLSRWLLNREFKNIELN